MPHPRTALVTGGSRGIGHRVCRELIRQGTFVIVHAPAQSDAHAAVGGLVRDGADPALVRAASADFRRLADVILLARTLVREFGQLDLLVNNAGARPDQVRAALGRQAGADRDRGDRRLGESGTCGTRLLPRASTQPVPRV